MGKRSKLEVLFAFVGAGMTLLIAVALCAPLSGCARTGVKIGELIEAVGSDFSGTVKKLAGDDKPEGKVVADAQ